MLQMVDIEFIRQKHLLDGWSVRQISRQLHLARQTVRRALATAEIPRYHLTKPRPCPAMDAFADIIHTWLDQDKVAPPKQRHTARRIYDRLVQEYSFTCAESTVRDFVAQLRPALNEVFIPLEPGWGQQAQADWGQAVVQIGAEQTVVHLFCLKMRQSGVPFVWVAPTEQLEAFLEGHSRSSKWAVPHCQTQRPWTECLGLELHLAPHRRRPSL